MPRGCDARSSAAWRFLFARRPGARKLLEQPRPPPASPADPFRALDDLMAAVEIFCNRWPARAVDRSPRRCLL